MCRNFWKESIRTLPMTTLCIILGDFFFYILFLNVQIAHIKHELFLLSRKRQLVLFFKIAGASHKVISFKQTAISFSFIYAKYHKSDIIRVFRNHFGFSFLFLICFISDMCQVIADTL